MVIEIMKNDVKDDCKLGKSLNDSKIGFSEHSCIVRRTTSRTIFILFLRTYYNVFKIIFWREERRKFSISWFKYYLLTSKELLWNFKYRKNIKISRQLMFHESMDWPTRCMSVTKVKKVVNKLNIKKSFWRNCVSGIVMKSLLLKAFTSLILIFKYTLEPLSNWIEMNRCN